jgi:hypothetical protein
MRFCAGVAVGVAVAVAAWVFVPAGGETILSGDPVITPDDSNGNPILPAPAA